MHILCSNASILVDFVCYYCLFYSNFCWDETFMVRKRRLRTLNIISIAQNLNKLAIKHQLHPKSTKITRRMRCRMRFFFNIRGACCIERFQRAVGNGSHVRFFNWKVVFWSVFLIITEITLNNKKYEVPWKYDFEDYSYYILRWDSFKKYKFEEFSCWAVLSR